MRQHGDRLWCWLAASYLGGILAANALAAKLFVLGPVHVTAGALAIPIVYLTTDLINELYGERSTRAVIWMGLLANLILVGMSRVCIAVPASPLGATQAEFVAIFSVTYRVVLASMLAYLVSSMLDARLFSVIKGWTGARHFWLRKNGSTVISQLIDTALFVLVAFTGLVPWHVIPWMILGQYLAKIIAAPLGTPLTYAVLWLAKQRWSRA